MAHLSGGLSDTAFASVTAARFKQDGFIVNPITGLDTGDDDTVAVRGALRLLPAIPWKSISARITPETGRTAKRVLFRGTLPAPLILFP